MKQESLLPWLDIAIEASVRAGEEILEVYHTDFAVEHKSDASPVTEADQKAHEAIVSQLEAAGLPILSEEGAAIPYATRKTWEYAWIVDPLDGTKEFVKRNGEFTVNIALVHRGEALGGVIYVPVKGWLYAGLAGHGAYKMEPCHEALDFAALQRQGSPLPLEQGARPFRVVGSRSHLSPQTEAYVDSLRERHDDLELTAIGSSLKFCLIAEGSADIYPRFAPTMEWDTAAGQAIVQAAGRQVLVADTLEPMTYNRPELRNPWFIAK